MRNAITEVDIAQGQEVLAALAFDHAVQIPEALLLQHLGARRIYKLPPETVINLLKTEGLITFQVNSVTSLYGITTQGRKAKEMGLGNYLKTFNNDTEAIYVRINALEQLAARIEAYDKAGRENDREAISLYHKWRTDSEVLFEQFIDGSDVRFSEFKGFSKEGNGYTLIKYFRRQKPLFDVLISHVSHASRPSIGYIKGIEQQVSHTKSGIKVFISHSSKDKIIVDGFVSLLRDPLRIGPEEIFSTSTEGSKITSGEEWRTAIRSALLGSEVVILMLSESYKKSEICLNEMGAAWMSNARVVPLMLPDVDYDSVGVLAEVKQVEKLADGLSLDRIKDLIEERLQRKRSPADLWTTRKNEFMRLCADAWKGQSSASSSLPQPARGVVLMQPAARDVGPSDGASEERDEFFEGILDRMDYTIFARSDGRKFETLDARVLNRDEGTVSIWLEVTNEHLKQEDGVRYMYLISHDSCGGKHQVISGAKRYLDVWAILREKNGANGNWRFVASNGKGVNTADQFTDERPTELGWHMFTVAWSRKRNEVVFYVDDRKQKSGPRNIWPTKVMDNFTIGSWAEGRSPEFYVQGNVGRVRCYNRALSSEELGQLFRATLPKS